jgi:transposase
MDTTPRPRYPSDVSDEEWAFLAPQRNYSLRELFNGLRSTVRTGLQWRFMPTDLPSWPGRHAGRVRCLCH